jgi:hypothetical protein
MNNYYILMGSNSSSPKNSSAPNGPNFSPPNNFNRKSSSNSNLMADNIKKLRTKHIRLSVEISPDDKFEQRKKSVEWFIEKLRTEHCNVEAEFKTLHKKNEEFYVCIKRESQKKIVFSLEDSHVDTVTGSLVNKKNYSLILNNIVEFLDK